MLKQVGSDPSWRARLVSNLVAATERKQSLLVKTDSGDLEEPGDTKLGAEGGEGPEDKCLICIFNVSASVAHTMFLVNKSSTAGDIIKLALEKRQGDTERGEARVEDFVLVEEIEIKDVKKKGKKLIHRMMNNDENVYLVQKSNFAASLPW